jgi:DNA-binding transcriptional MerR regulator
VRAKTELDESLRVSGGAVVPGEDPGLRIGDVAARVGVSTRTLRYYEELGILSPSLYTAGGERRYRPEDLKQLEQILELKELLGMNLEEIKATLASQVRLEELRAAYRENKSVESPTARARRRSILIEALELRTALIARMDEKLEKMAAFRAQLHSDADRCRALLEDPMATDSSSSSSSRRPRETSRRAPEGRDTPITQANPSVRTRDQKSTDKRSRRSAS